MDNGDILKNTISGYEGSKHIVGSNKQKQIGIYFRNDLGIGFVDEGVKQTVTAFMVQACGYVVDLMPDPQYLPDNLVVNFSVSGRFMGLGMEIKVPVEEVKENFMDLEESSYERKLVVSILVHELVHSICTTEELPMLAEMIYMLENDGGKRIEQIKYFYEAGELEKKHTEAVGVIAGWFGFGSTKDLFEGLKSMDINDIKLIFRNKAKEYYESD